MMNNRLPPSPVVSTSTSLSAGLSNHSYGGKKRRAELAEAGAARHRTRKKKDPPKK